MLGYLYCKGCGRVLRVSDLWHLVRCGACTCLTQVRRDRMYEHMAPEDFEDHSASEQPVVGANHE